MSSVTLPRFAQTCSASEYVTDAKGGLHHESSDYRGYRRSAGAGRVFPDPGRAGRWKTPTVRGRDHDRRGCRRGGPIPPPRRPRKMPLPAAEEAVEETTTAVEEAVEDATSAVEEAVEEAAIPDREGVVEMRPKRVEGVVEDATGEASRKAPVMRLKRRGGRRCAGCRRRAGDAAAAGGGRTRRSMPRRRGSDAADTAPMPCRML
jgi:hypothetical protein